MYALIGEQLYANKTNRNLGFYQNFDDFYSSFFCIFQVLTMYDWADVEVLTLNTHTLAGVTELFLISLIIIGNYIFLSLFISILINGFVLQSQVKTEEEIEEMNRLRIQAEKEQLTLIEAEEKKSQDVFVEELVEKKDSKEKILFKGIECEKSLYIFSKQWRIRKYIHLIVFSNAFESIIMIMIILSSVKLALDTYDLFGNSANSVDIFINITFILEATFKIISNGFCVDKGSYLRNRWNILDLIIVIISLVDMFSTNVNLSYQKVL